MCTLNKRGEAIASCDPDVLPRALMAPDRVIKTLAEIKAEPGFDAIEIKVRD